MLYNNRMDDITYAVWPGSVTLYDGTVRTFTALELATAYGVQDEPYLTITNESQLPRDPKKRLKIIELKPRQDDKYQNYKYVAEDDGQEIAYRPDFDGKKRYIQETDPNNVDPDIDFDFNKDNNYR